jgi:hypothetical protein
VRRLPAFGPYGFLSTRRSQFDGEDPNNAALGDTKKAKFIATPAAK